MTLPDIDEQSWDAFTRERLQRDLQSKIDSFGLQQAINEKIAGAQSLLGGAQAEPAPAPAPVAPPPELQPFEPAAPPSSGQMQAAAIASGQATPEPEAPSAPVPMPGPPPDVIEQGARAVPMPSPPADVLAGGDRAVRMPTPAAPAGSAGGDWVAQMLANVASSGGDVQRFAQGLNDAGGATVQNALAAAHGAGADIQRFSSGLTARPLEPDLSAAGPSPGGVGPSGTPASVGGVPGWLSDLIARNAPPELQGDPDFIRTVAAGAKAESGWDVNSVQKGGGGRGLFQFDLGGMGKPYANNESVLLGQEGAQLQASQIVPLYAKAYASAPQGLTGAEKASWVAAQAERPYQYDNPQSSARRNYASAYGEIGGGDQNLLQRAGSAVVGAAQGAVQAVKNQVSQFGDSQLSNDEAYAACGPAAAVRFAQMYGRNPSLREATDLAKSVGWTSGGGMAGIGSEQQLMSKMGIQTKLTNDVSAMAREAQTGNPVTISTPGHYFFADGYDPNTGAFHVGQSGLDLKGGSEWMTPAQMESRMGAIQGGLLADNPQVPATSTAEMDSNPVSYLGKAKDAIGSAISGAKQAVEDMLPPAYRSTPAPAAQDAQTSALDNVVRSVGSKAQELAANVPDISPQGLISAGQRIGSGQPTEQDQAVIDELTRPHLRGVGEALTQATGVQPIDITEDPTKQLSQARQQLGKDVMAGTESVVPQGIPLLSGLGNLGGQLVGGILSQPGALDSADTIAELTAKYPVGGANGNLAGILPNVDAMTPEDRQRYSEAMMNIGGITQPIEGGAGALRPAGRMLGREVGQAAERALSAEARQMLRSFDLGGVPTAITNGMRRVAEDNGIRVTPEMTPNNVLDALRAKTEAPAPTAAATAVEGARAAPGETVTTETPNATVSARFGEPTEAPAAAPEAPAPRSSAFQDLLDTVRRGETPPERPAPQGEPITLSPEAERTRLNLGDYPEELRPIISEHAEGIDWARLQRRGVVSDDASQAAAEQYAKDTTLSQMISEGKAGQTYNDYQIRALKNATGAQAATVRDVASKIAEGGDTSEALRTFAVEAERLDQLVRIAEGGRAESGRALRAWADPSRLVNLKPEEAVAEITKTMGGDRSKLLEMIGNYNQLVADGAGPTKLANFWASAKQPPAGISDWIRLIRYNSMLSGPRTFEVNAVSNALELPWRLARDVGASTLRGRPGEVGVELSGALAGFAKGNRAFLDTLFQGITPERAARGELPLSLANRVQNPVGKGIARVLEGPTRLLSAADEWAQAIDYSMSMGRLAARQASEEGLRGDAWKLRTSQILANPETAPELMKRAAGMADRMTFHGGMPTAGEGKAGRWGLGAGLEAFSERSGLIGNIVLPFLRTTYHITSRGIDRSPLGLVGTGIDVARGAYGRDLGKALSGEAQHIGGAAPLGERLGDNLMGSAIFAGLYFQAHDGNISGAGPDSATDRNLLRSEGWQPYSVRVGDKWVSYANWGPAAIPFAMAAAASETQRYGKPGGQTLDYVIDGARRTTQIAQEQTYLQAIGSAWKGITDPTQYGSQFVNDTITSLIPFGAGINTLAQAMDPNARRVDRFNILDAIQSRLPSGTPIIGGRSDVPASQDVLGRPLPNLAYGAGALNPLRVSQEQPDQPLLNEMDRVGYAPPPAPKTFTRPGFTYELTPDEQRQIYADAGNLIAQRANADIQTPAYQKLNDTAKAKRLEMIVTNARTETENKWLKSLSAADLEQRRAQSRARKEIVPVSGRT